MQESLIIWGIHPVEEILKVRPEDIIRVEILPTFGRKRNQKLLLELLGSKGLVPVKRPDFHKKNLPKGAVHQGVCAEVRVFWEKDVQEIVKTALASSHPIVVCDQIEDPQNLGAIIRSSVAFDAAGLVIPKRQNAPINGTVVKASSGAVFHTQVSTTMNLFAAIETIKSHNIPVVALDAKGAVRIYEVEADGPMCLVLGSEAKGIRKNVRKMADILCSIPINPVLDSLNVSSAASVALYEFKRKRLLAK